MAEHDPNSAPRQRIFVGRTSGDEEAALVDERRDYNQHNPPNVTSEKPSRGSHHLGIDGPDTEGLYRFWRRFTRKGKKNIGVMQSLRAIVLSSCMPLTDLPAGGNSIEFQG